MILDTEYFEIIYPLVLCIIYRLNFHKLYIYMILQSVTSGLFFIYLSHKNYFSTKMHNLNGCIRRYLDSITIGLICFLWHETPQWHFFIVFKISLTWYFIVHFAPLHYIFQCTFSLFSPFQLNLLLNRFFSIYIYIFFCTT